MGYRDHRKFKIAWPSGAKDQQLIILIGHPAIFAIQLQPLQDKGHEIKCDFIGRDGYFETARIAVETVSWKKSNCVWIWAIILRDFVDLKIGNSEICFIPERCRISFFKKKSHSVPHKNSLKPSSRIKTQKNIGFVWTPPSICNQTYPSTWCTLHKFHAQTIFFATIQSPGNDFGLWSAQLALPWWCPDPCCGMWRSLSATVDPQRSEIQDGRVVPRALWLGSSVVFVILVTYGFLMAFTI